MSRFSEARLRAAGFVAVLLSLAAAWTTTAVAQTCTERAMIIVAHQDDDIIFFNPDEVADISAGRCVRIVYVTAGDAGGTHPYWGNRELATVRGHESMAGVAPAPAIVSSMNVRGHKLARRKLANAPRIDIVFLRLPDGNIPGGGFERNNNESLRKLWIGSAEGIASINTVPDADFDGLADPENYSKTELIWTLYGLMVSFQPDTVRTQNYLESDLSGGGAGTDHSDHVSAAHFAREAAKRYANATGKVLGTLLKGYRGYEVFRYKQNVFGANLNKTLTSFAAYVAVEGGGVCIGYECTSYDQSFTDFWGYPRWLRRQYRLGQATPAMAETEIHGWGGKCMDLENGIITNGNPVQIFACAGVDAQKWLYDPAARTIKPFLNSNRCLRSRGAYPPANGAKVDVFACNGSDSQKWLLTRDGEFLHQGGRCLEAPGGSPTDGADLVVRDCSYHPKQLWGYEEAAIRIGNPHTFETGVIAGKCLNADAGLYASDAPLNIRPCNGSLNQIWRFTVTGRLRGPAGKCAASTSVAMLNGEPAVTQPCDRTDPGTVSPHQRWTFGSPSLIHFRPSPDTNKCFEVQGGVSADGTEVELQDCAGDIPRQHWNMGP